MVPRLLAGIAGTTAIPSPARRPSMGDGNERRVSRRRLRARTTTSSSESSRGSHDEAHEGQTVSISGSGAASGGLRVDSVGQKTTRGTPQPHPHSVGVGRRQSLGFAAAAAAAALSPVQSARAAYETQMSSQPSAGEERAPPHHHHIKHISKCQKIQLQRILPLSRPSGPRSFSQRLEYLCTNVP